MALVPGGDDAVLANGDAITITQSAVSLESLLGRFIFSVTELTAKQNAEAPQGGNAPATPATPAPAP